ncbi:hypothetical protein GA845_32355 [Burkholderia pseudomallei]|nr:hypothetical protein [Burkholderia pseudomallei]
MTPERADRRRAAHRPVSPRAAPARLMLARCLNARAGNAVRDTRRRAGRDVSRPDESARCGRSGVRRHDAYGTRRGCIAAAFAIRSSEAAAMPRIDCPAPPARNTRAAPPARSFN